MREAVSATGARSDVGSSLRVLLLQARQHRLRGIFNLAADLAGANDELEQFWTELQDLSDLHDQKIDNHLLFSVIPYFAES